VTLGERGEVTPTGGFNFCLPLLRYRTGDYPRLLRRGADQDARITVEQRTSCGDNLIQYTSDLPGALL
jgi:phenylacetate-coenzyme A ligase PaaK-like adenylate-forming protein